MQVHQSNIQPGAAFTNGSRSVRVAVNHGVRGGLRLDQEPPSGLVHVPWFRAEQDVADFLNRGGHATGVPFQPIAQ